jgi:anti-sigma B factor antagonist
MARATERIRDRARLLADMSAPLPVQRRLFRQRSPVSRRPVESDDSSGGASFRATTYVLRGVLVVEGQIDMSTAGALKDRLHGLFAEGHRDVIVDLSMVQFMDSSGLSVLIGGLKAARRSGGTLRVVGTSRQMHELFQVTGVHKVLPLFDSVAAAADGSPPASPVTDFR